MPTEGAPAWGGNGGEKLDPARARAVLIVLAAAALMVMYVETMIIPGLTRFQSFYDNAPLSSVTWILAAYLLVGVAFTPVAGKLGDIYGKKRVLIAILSVYLVAVSLAGFSPNIGDAIGMSRPDELYLLIGIRAVQGTGMAMFPLAFAMIGEEFPPQKVAGAQGIVSAMFAAGSSLGLFGGAWITQTFGWQLTYHTVIPIAAVVLTLAILVLHESRVRLDQSVDVAGAASLALALAFFLVALTEGPTWGWGNWTGATVAGVTAGVPEFFVLAAVFLVVFVLWERASPRPIIDFAKLGERNILLANTVGFVAGVAMFLMFVGLVARVESATPVGLGLTPLDFGFYTLPTSLVNLVSAPLVGRSISRFGPKPTVLLGSGLIVLGGSLLALYNTTVIDLVLCPIPIMTGIIMIFISKINMVVLSSKPQETGVQTGMSQTFQNLGTAVGPVVASTILASVLTTFTQVVVTPGGPVTVHFQAPGASAFQLIFGLIAVVGAVSFLLALPIRNFRYLSDGTRVAARTLPSRRPSPAAAPAEPARGPGPSPERA
jgi:MFS family permease